MLPKKRGNRTYSDLSQEQKNQRNARRKARRLETKQRESALFPVHIEAEIANEENIKSSFLFNGIEDNSSMTEDTLFDQNPLSLATSSSIIQEPSYPAPNKVLLHDVPIGITFGTLMPQPTTQQKPIPDAPYELPLIPDCRFCGAKKFPYETANFCCGGGQISLYTTEMPPRLRELYSGFGPESAHFLQYIKAYNDIFSFTSMGFHLDPKYAKQVHGIYSFRAQGPIYHFIDSLYPSGEMPSHLQLYFYDTEKEVSNRLGARDQLQPCLISDLIDILKPNPYSQFFRSLNHLNNIEDYQIILRSDPDIQDPIALPPTVSQVATIRIENEDGAQSKERDIIIQKHNGLTQTISHYFGCYDPLQYPLLYPLGEPGWHREIKKNKAGSIRKPCLGQGEVLPSHATTVAELFSNEATVRQTNNDEESMVSAREFYAYRFQIRRDINSILLESGELLQQFVVDMYAKIQTSRLDYFRHKQDEIRADLYQGIVDSIQHGDSDGSKIGKRIVLPSSFIGGPRDIHKRYLDAMTLVERYGKPDLFLTMTCNPNWKEIKAELKPHEEPHNRPDLLSRVFRSKIQHLQKEVVKKELFGGVSAYTFVIEFQERGLPHVHMLIMLKRGYKINTVETIDKFISAELPDKEQQPHLYAMVTRHMMHGPCGQLNMENACMKNHKCKNHYPRNFCQETSVEADSYPIYRRRDTGSQVYVRGRVLDNRWVVPYNPYLLATFDCHINVEVCSSIKAVKYLYKYICKGHDKIIYRLATSNSTGTVDEIQQYQEARWISPPEAMWRIYRFALYEICPAVITLQLHLEGCQLIPFKKDTNLQTIADNQFLSRTMLTEFFWMNAHNEKAKSLKLLYKNFPEHFVWTSQRLWTERKRQEVIGRIVTANPTEGERYYLRLLLTHIPAPPSYAYLRTIKGVTYDSYREGAIAHGLLEDGNHNEKCMEEASAYQMPISLRQLFCIILAYCTARNPRELFLKFEDPMAEDYIKIQRVCKDVARQLLLQALDRELQSMSKSLQDFQLHHLLITPTSTQKLCKELEEELDIYISEEDLMSPTLLNSEQKEAYDEILDAVFSHKPQSFFIDGAGGTGKTFLYRSLLAKVRSQHQIALATASSGVAASILPNGRTAHSRFKISIEREGMLSCNISKQTGLATLIKQASLIIWDEASMAKREIIEALDNLLRDLMDNQLLFGGKVVVFGGDFRQVLPVVPKGTRADCVQASFIYSYIWTSLKKFKLKRNMRARTDPAFSKYILRIGDGLEKEDDAGHIKLPAFLVLEPIAPTTALDKLIDFVFPSITNGRPDPSSLTNSAILTPKNVTVDEINDKMISRFPGEDHVYLSFDETTGPTHRGLYIDFLNSIAPPGMPLHKLLLKENCPVMLLRNLNPSKGLCNGTRLLCKEFRDHMIVAEIAVGEKAGNTVFIPRIPVQPNDPQHYPIAFTRLQFPVRICFAMTINKAQGQTLKNVGLYLPEPVFSHGQLYVALSRAVAGNKIRVYIKHSENDPRSYYRTKNIVYSEVLEAANSL